MRSVFTDLRREEMISSLKENEAFLTLDFAQRWLPQKHYEAQKGYFAKKGLSLHITHVLANISGSFAQHSLVHLLTSDVQVCAQSLFCEN